MNLEQCTTLDEVKTWLVEQRNGSIAGILLCGHIDVALSRAAALARREALREILSTKSWKEAPLKQPVLWFLRDSVWFCPMEDLQEHYIPTCHVDARWIDPDVLVKAISALPAGGDGK